MMIGGVLQRKSAPRKRRADSQLVVRSIATNILPNGAPCRLDRGGEARVAYPSRQTKGRRTISAGGCVVNRKMDKLPRHFGTELGTPKPAVLALEAATTFLSLLLDVGAERIMFAADYPDGSMAEAHSFLKQIPVSAADREHIAHGSAERLFGL